MRHEIALGLTVVVVAVASGAVWAAEEAAPAAKPDAAGSSSTDRLKEIRLIEIRYLRTGESLEFEKGRRKVLDIKDEAAIAPLVTVLYGTNARYRGLLIEALGAFASRGSKVAQAYLQDIAVGDGSVPHRRRAVDELKGWSGDRPTDRLMAHLATQEIPALRGRAATALAALEERRAVWLLVERLVTEDVRMVGAEVWDGQITMDIRGQQADVTRPIRTQPISAAVPGAGIATANIELPEVAIVDFATTVSMGDKHVVPKYERVRTEHPEILAALKTLTGKDFGYNQGAWQKWLQSTEASKSIPPWEPPGLKRG